MPYLVLARKWRPNSFTDLIGQSHVVRALSYALDNDLVHHAYLFTGTRGVGKTSIARIFAKSLNCETNGVSANPCGLCSNCKDIEAGKFVDLLEVDAASRTGVEETRELIESIAYLPAKGRYKVYLIDEVHMFSKSSFNALLKTLEEPPPHVKFILATTDPEKLPITVLSRCLQFNLKSLTEPQINQHLVNICQAESIDYEAPALAVLANSGEGSMRDTLSITDQAIAYGQGKLTLSAVTEILGTTHPADIEAVLLAILDNNPSALYTQLRKLDDYDLDAKNFLLALMRQLQTLAWAKEGINVELPTSISSALANIPKELIQLWYQIAQKGLEELVNALEPRQTLEMTLLRMLAFIPDELIARHHSITEIASNPAASTITTPATPADNKIVSDNEVATETQSTKPIATIVPEQASLEQSENDFFEKAPPPLTQTPVNASLQPAIKAQQDSEAMPSTPSMDEINAMMQRASNIAPPSLVSAEKSEGGNEHPPSIITAKTATETLPWEAEKPISQLENEPTEAEQPAHIQQAIAETVSKPSTEVKSNDNIVKKAVIEDNQSLANSPILIDKSESLKKSADFDWFETFQTLSLSGFTREFAGNGVLSIDNDIATLNIAPQNEVLRTDDSKAELQQALQQQLGEQIKLEVVTTELNEIPPAQRLLQTAQQQSEDLVNQFKSDPVVKSLVDELGATILEQTIKAKTL